MKSELETRVIGLEETVRQLQADNTALVAAITAQNSSIADLTAAIEAINEKGSEEQ